MKKGGRGPVPTVQQTQTKSRGPTPTVQQIQSDVITQVTSQTDFILVQFIQCSLHTCKYCQIQIVFITPITRIDFGLLILTTLRYLLLSYVFTTYHYVCVR